MSKPLAGITRNVAALGVVSLLTDISSEMIIPVLPIFVTVTLGASMASLGMIEGVAESTAAILRIASGWLSDRVGQRKPFIVFGYGVSVVAKAGLVGASAWPAVLGLRFIERVGKGLRSPPRDALLADSSEPRVPRPRVRISSQHGHAGRRHRPAGGVRAAVRAPRRLSARVRDRHRPGGAVGAGAAAVRERAAPHRLRRRNRCAASGARSARPLRRFLAADAVFQLGNSSMAFVLLRTRDVGFSAGQVTLVYFGYNVIFALLALPLGGLSDRLGRRPLILGGYLLYAVVYGLLGATTLAPRARWWRSRSWACTAR